MCPDFCIVCVFISCVELYIIFFIKKMFAAGFIAETWSQNSFFKPRNTEVTESEQEKIIRLVLFSGDRLPDLKSTDQSRTIQESVWFPGCSKFAVSFLYVSPADTPALTSLRWLSCLKSNRAVRGYFGPESQGSLEDLQVLEEVLSHPFARFLLFLQQQSLHLLRRRRQRLFTPLMYRRTNLINLPRRHIFISAIWDGGSEGGGLDALESCTCSYARAAHLRGL